MRRWRSWKWRLAGVGDEKGRSGPVTRICKRERCAVESATEVETDQQQLPWSKCRIVERTFAWLGRYRRLAKDWENLNRKPLAFLRLASIRLMLRKLCNPSTASGHSRRGLSRATVDRLPLHRTSGRKVATWESVAKGHHRHFALQKKTESFLMRGSHHRSNKCPDLMGGYDTLVVTQARRAAHPSAVASPEGAAFGATTSSASSMT
jgi:hypothetical protein